MPRNEATLSAARLLALLLPAALLAGAYGSQYIGHLVPCQMCWWQRYPHFAAVGIAMAALLLRKNPPASATFTALAALAIATSGAIGVYHAGVEYKWWEGFTTCTTLKPVGGDMLEAIMSAPLIRCDQPQWTLMGISLAGFNAIISLGGAAAVFMLLRRWSKGA